MLRRLVSSLAVLAVVGAMSIQAHEIWTENYAEAKVSAEKDSKDLLLEFTGSDWCPYCVKLRHEVFDTSDFKSKAPKEFVLVELDFPQTKKQADATKAQNQELQEKYGIDGFPTVLLTDPAGVPYAKLGYGPDTASMTDHMISLRKRKATRDDLFSRAKLATGAEKARLLDQAITGLGKDEFVARFDDVLDQIVTADSENKAGLKAKYGTRVELRPVIKMAESGDVDGAIGKLDAVLKEKDAPAVRKQEVLYMKAILLQFKSDKDGSIASLKEAYKLDQNSDRGKEIGEILKEIEKGN